MCRRARASSCSLSSHGGVGWGRGSTAQGVDESEDVVVGDHRVRDGDQMLAPGFEAGGASGWGYVDAVAVQADVDLAAGGQAHTVSQLLGQDDSSHGIHGCFHREKATNEFPALIAVASPGQRLVRDVQTSSRPLPTTRPVPSSRTSSPLTATVSLLGRPSA